MPDLLRLTLKILIISYSLVSSWVSILFSKKITDVPNIKSKSAANNQIGAENPKALYITPPSDGPNTIPMPKQHSTTDWKWCLLLIKDFLIITYKILTIAFPWFFSENCCAPK